MLHFTQNVRRLVPRPHGARASCSILQNFTLMSVDFSPASNTTVIVRGLSLCSVVGGTQFWIAKTGRV